MKNLYILQDIKKIQVKLLRVAITEISRDIFTLFFNYVSMFAYEYVPECRCLLQPEDSDRSPGTAVADHHEHHNVGGGN